MSGEFQPITDYVFDLTGGSPEYTMQYFIFSDDQETILEQGTLKDGTQGFQSKTGILFVAGKLSSTFDTNNPYEIEQQGILNTEQQEIRNFLKSDTIQKNLEDYELGTDFIGFKQINPGTLNITINFFIRYRFELYANEGGAIDALIKNPKTNVDLNVSATQDVPLRITLFYNSDIILTPKPDEGYKFIGFSDDIKTLDSNNLVRASFEKVDSPDGRVDSFWKKYRTYIIIAIVIFLFIIIGIILAIILSRKSKK
jgi:hypothetical protein